MVTPYLAQQSVNDFGALVSAQKFSATLAPATDTAFLVPGDSPRYKVVIRSVGPTWFAVNQVAESPAGAAFALSTSELNSLEGVCHEVKANDVLHFLSTAGTQVSLVFYSLNSNN